MSCCPGSLRRPDDLVAAGLIPPAAARRLAPVVERYPMALTAALAALIDPADPADPIARQFIPDPAELRTAPEERDDPIGDARYSPVPGLVHRYPDRVLLAPVLSCPAYCRFCFRRARVGQAAPPLDDAQIDAALAYVTAQTTVREVVLTGGEPLMLGAARLGRLRERLAAIPHLDVVRVHTRLPIVDPGRVDAAMVAALAGAADAAGPAVWVAVHVNHPRELAPPARAALARLAAAGLPLLSQTVLLRGVNDTVETLEALLRALVRARVRPYYLHHPDLAPGTAPFRPTIAEGQALLRALRGRLSGIALPHYVLDIPGGFGKVPVGPGYLRADGTVCDPNGAAHPYPPAGRDA